MSTAAEYLQELRERIAAYDERDIEGAFRERDRKPPGRFNDSSFLYMRSQVGDQGARPLPGGVFWLSPDIELRPAATAGPPTSTLQAGDTYRVRCTLRNRGDVGVPSAKVELFITDPSLGFDTRVATNITLGHVPSAWVASAGVTPVDFLWRVPASLSGHRCLFARAFSFSPLDAPGDPHALDPRIDRHVAQRNLNITGQAQPFSFRLVHGAKTRMRIDLRPLGRDEMLRLDDPALAEHRVAEKLPERGWERLMKIELAEAAERRMEIEPTEGGLLVISSGDGPGVDAQRKILRQAREAFGRDQAGRHRRVDRTELSARLAELGEFRRSSMFRLTTPDLGLEPGEMAAVHITSIDDGDEKLGFAGGITLVVTGD